MLDQILSSHCTECIGAMSGPLLRRWPAPWVASIANDWFISLSPILRFGSAGKCGIVIQGNPFKPGKQPWQHCEHPGHSWVNRVDPASSPGCFKMFDTTGSQWER